MGARADFWRRHVVALNLAGVTSKAYADQHGLSVHSLHFAWTRAIPGIAAQLFIGLCSLKLGEPADERAFAGAQRVARLARSGSLGWS